MEILAIAIRKEEKIKGIPIDNTQSAKLSQLADDTTCFLSDEQSGSIILQCLEDFSKLSGL